MSKIKLFVDGVEYPYTQANDWFSDGDSGLVTVYGGEYGCKDNVLTFTCGKEIAIVDVINETPAGINGLRGFFARGEWKGTQDAPEFWVWERLA